MNSVERHKNRYIRRKAARDAKRAKKICVYDDFEQVFTWDNLFASYRRSCLGVGWKCSTQLYKTNATINVTDTYLKLINNKYKSGGFYEFTIMERGKLRHIKSVHISERVVQKCLCDYSLTPMLSRTFIYDNGACMKNKGIDFAINRLKRHLRSFYRHNGIDGYVLTFDFSKYFDTINHEILKQKIAEKYTDQRILRLIYDFIDNFGGDAGLGLGSQISQTCALFYPSEIDHAIKEKMHIKYYGRYMDDGYLIHHSKEHLKECLKLIEKLCDSLGIKLNKDKTQITKLSRSFTFLKKRIRLTETGKIVMKISKKSIKAMRHKLHCFKSRLENHEMSIDRIEQSFTSWIGHARGFDTYKTVQSLTNYFNKLFGNSNQSYIAKMAN